MTNFSNLVRLLHLPFLHGKTQAKIHYVKLQTFFSASNILFAHILIDSNNSKTN